MFSTLDKNLLFTLNLENFSGLASLRSEVPLILSFQSSPEFYQLLAGNQAIDLARVALEIAQDVYPNLDVESIFHILDSLAYRVRQKMDRNCPGLFALKEVLFEEEGFQGNHAHYYDPRNSYLNEILDRKKGIPITLSLLSIAVAERAGLSLFGVNLPSHFITCTGPAPERVYLDPFQGGKILNLDECRQLAREATGQLLPLSSQLLEPCPSQTLILRMLRNLKAIYSAEGNTDRAYFTLHRIVALTSEEEPNFAVEQRDLALACFETKRPRLAKHFFEAYLKCRPSAEDATSIGLLISEAARQIQAQH